MMIMIRENLTGATSARNASSWAETAVVAAVVVVIAVAKSLIETKKLVFFALVL